MNGIGSFAISNADRLGVFTVYGWEYGLSGEFTDARVETLANQAITATPAIPNPAHAYPAVVVTLITAQLAIVNANQPIATGARLKPPRPRAIWHSTCCRPPTTACSSGIARRAMTKAKRRNFPRSAPTSPSLR